MHLAGRQMPPKSANSSFHELISLVAHLLSLNELQRMITEKINTGNFRDTQPLRPAQPEDTVTPPTPPQCSGFPCVCLRSWSPQGPAWGMGCGKGRRECGAGAGELGSLSLRKPSPGITQPVRLGWLSGQSPALACPPQTTPHPFTHCPLPLSWAPVEPGWMCPQPKCGGTSVNLDKLSGLPLCRSASLPEKTGFSLHSLCPREHHPQRSDSDGGHSSCSTSTTLNNRLDSETPALTLLSA